MILVPMLNLKQIIEMDAADRSKAGQPGVPADSLDNQLKDWIYNARLANIGMIKIANSY
jgi:hypothetical protein